MTPEEYESWMPHVMEVTITPAKQLQPNDIAFLEVAAWHASKGKLELTSEKYCEDVRSLIGHVHWLEKELHTARVKICDLEGKEYP